MRSAIRMYLGKVKGIYRYGAVSGRHESFTDAETVDGLSYLTLEVYEQVYRPLPPPSNLITDMLTVVGTRAQYIPTHSTIRGAIKLRSRAIHPCTDIGVDLSLDCGGIAPAGR